tara:strand:+ start:2517 stop:2732 length:216 start_codon:yes stop_codon:yes gene_type:complete
MNKRKDILKEILSDSELMAKYKISQEELNDLQALKPGSKKIVNILYNIINENDNNRSATQIYKIIKNIHKI